MTDETKEQIQLAPVECECETPTTTFNNADKRDHCEECGKVVDVEKKFSPIAHDAEACEYVPHKPYDLLTPSCETGYPITRAILTQAGMSYCPWCGKRIVIKASHA